MRVNWEEKIHGVGLLHIRNFLWRFDSGRVWVCNVAERLGVSEPIARIIARDLLERGWIERDPGEEAAYRVTSAGRCLAYAKKVPRIDRSKANQLVEAVVQRIALVHSNDDLFHYVDEARLFGSYIDPLAEDLGNINIAIRLKRRSVRNRDLNYAIERARYLGKASRGYPLLHCENELRAILVRRSPYISLCGIDDLEEIRVPSMPFWPPQN